MSGDIASRLRAVSTSVSPFTTLDVPIATLRVSALRRFSAISNDVRVRVLGSKNRFTTVFPRSAGTFLPQKSADPVGDRVRSCPRGNQDYRGSLGCHGPVPGRLVHRSPLGGME